MRFLPVSAYIEALHVAIPRAKQRIVINAADIRWGEQLSTFLPLFSEAAKRGVEVRIIADIYSKYMALAPHPNRSDPAVSWKQNLAIAAQLQTAGARFSYIGKLGLNPFAHRTHTKITIIDNQLYTFGGVNFCESSLKNKDYMLSMHDPILADRLYRLIGEIEKAGPRPLPDFEEQLGGQAMVLFDGGTPKTSAIYDTACRLAASAKKLYLVSQMCPSGKLARLINNTDNYCYFIHTSQADPPANIGMWLDQKRYHIKNQYTGSAYIHAKFLLTEDKNGDKHLLSGSNNFSYRGVKFGTKEIAVHSTDPVLWQAFYDFMQQQIVGQPAQR